MVAIADKDALYLLEFVDRKAIESEINRLQSNLNTELSSGKNDLLLSLEKELKLYFEGGLTTFSCPIKLLGTSFQKNVWEELKKIPIGETRSYLDIARNVEKPTAFRAVALANSCNQLAIIVPCHRVINHNGKLGGYAAGLNRKTWLLQHEKTLKA